ncbi:hypothetical protein B9Z39_03445 [Limnohabitans sp. JirII-29]|uniref:hypothetical protein n=1 Tax=Limnohabitans sp. JirII-29 TaxID=1835756 RepID=UPI000D365DE3|nr:hypothetical protein [Limnohabitans sp. JirII-29]PUE29140.1 hypothetical protein B9Z39_03445 [Limnohabitans sp. JirII-29]
MRLNWFKISYGFLIFLMSLLLVQYAAQIFAGGHSWKTGDWLINYSDGFIRRGLSGSISITISQILSVNVKWVIFSIQAAIFISFIVLTLREFYQFKESPKSVFLLLSPAFAFMFWVNDPAVAFRKEITIYLALIFILKAFQRSEINFSWYWASLAIFAFSGLSHEITVFFLPFFVFPIFNHFTQKNLGLKPIVKYAAPFIALSISILLTSYLYKGSQQSMDVICASLAPYDLKSDICEGAISWLKYDAKFGVESVIKLGSDVWGNYFFLAVLSMLPILLHRSDNFFQSMIVAGFLSMLPLFIVAVDYGRFISMIYTAIVLVAIWTRPNLIHRIWSVSWLIGCVYCFFWALPNCCKNFPGRGLLGNALFSALKF